MVYDKFIIIKDRASTGSLWEGEEVYMLARTFNISAANVIANRPKTFQDITQTTADTDAGDTSTNYINNYNRRKSNISYSGFQNQQITINCIYNQDINKDNVIANDATIEGNSRKLFTPSKLYELILKPRTVYIKDSVLINLISAIRDTSPTIYNTYGIPVILSSWNIVPSLEGKQVNMDLVFIEDKEIG